VSSSQVRKSCSKMRNPVGSCGESSAGDPRQDPASSRVFAFTAKCGVVSALWAGRNCTVVALTRFEDDERALVGDVEQVEAAGREKTVDGKLL